MSSVCISNCVNDARDPRVPVRATYVNLYKWPESDAEFIKSVHRVGQGFQGQPRVVDSISCRQMYLRSYTFSRKESVPERTKKCFGRVKEKVAKANHGKNKKKDQKGRRRKCLVFRKVKEFSCGALFRIFHRLLSCGASIDVVDQKDSN
ncbi:hypothetical protein P3X46_008986 [Hevea brasiliensis]|uniref:Uncharacterized protein n=1 Tax=Hevea brasiliensis TaxID=3981 RepID=A0ABQ9MMZ4_HEVBR|nr:uncharacterized protein LOC110664298 [Hevea brasiliensis]KAJ9180778.1 hypothetical protein P3X46_008986 [Hevea brasiliensis]